MDEDVEGELSGRWLRMAAVGSCRFGGLLARILPARAILEGDAAMEEGRGRTEL